MQPLTEPELWVAGRPLLGRVSHGDLKISHRWPYGCWEVEFGVATKPYQRFSDIVTDAAVEVRLGAGQFWAGNLTEPDWSSGTLRAVGAARQGETTLCLTSGGDTTATPDTAVDQAISRGAVDWARLASLSSATFGATDSMARLNYLTALLDAWSTANGKRWGVDGYRRVYANADPGTPSIFIRPDSGELGVTNERQVGKIFGRYMVSGGGFATVTVGSGRPEVGVFLGKRGVLTSGEATAIITGIRDQAGAQATWTNGWTLTYGQVVNLGGTPRALSQILAGRMARGMGLRDERNGAANTDVVLGETVWDVTAATVQANPVGMVGTTLSDAVENAGGELL